MSRTPLRHAPLVAAVAVLAVPAGDLMNRLYHRARTHEEPHTVTITAERTRATGDQSPPGRIPPGRIPPGHIPPGHFPVVPGEGSNESFTTDLPGTIEVVRRSSSSAEIVLVANSAEFAHLLDRMRSTDRLRRVHADRLEQGWAVRLYLEPARNFSGGETGASYPGSEPPSFPVEELARAFAGGAPPRRGALTPDRFPDRFPDRTAGSAAAAGTSPVSFGMVRFSSGTTLRWYRRADLLHLARTPGGTP